jgi:membrane-bound ClpP family serine protease
MLQDTGNALTAIEPGGIGRVATHGEIWSATSAEPIQAGERVAVVGIKGLLLTVRRM